MGMTPDETRIRTKSANLARENLHRNCSVEIRSQGPHLGLYCVNSKCRKKNAWISWITKQQAQSLL